MANVLTISWIILILSLSALSIYSIIYLRDRNRELEYENLKNTKIDVSCLEILDTIIKDTFDEYILLNVSLTSEEILYINSELETRITKDVSGIVLETISPALYQKLNALYNMDTVPGIIGKKVYFMTTEFVVNHNSVFQDKE